MRKIITKKKKNTRRTQDKKKIRKTKLLKNEQKNMQNPH